MQKNPHQLGFLCHKQYFINIHLFFRRRKYRRIIPENYKPQKLEHINTGEISKLRLLSRMLTAGQEAKWKLGIWLIKGSSAALLKACNTAEFFRSHFRVSEKYQPNEFWAASDTKNQLVSFRLVFILQKLQFEYQTLPQIEWDVWPWTNLPREPRRFPQVPCRKDFRRSPILNPVASQCVSTPKNTNQWAAWKLQSVIQFRVRTGCKHGFYFWHWSGLWRRGKSALPWRCLESVFHSTSETKALWHL